MAFQGGDISWLSVGWLTKKDPNFDVIILNLVKGYVLCTVVDKK